MCHSTKVFQIEIISSSPAPRTPKTNNATTVNGHSSISHATKVPMTKRQLLFAAGLLATAGLITQYDHLLIIHTGIFHLSQSTKQPTKAQRFDPFVNRWQRKFYANRRRDGYLFFKHIRKAGDVIHLVHDVFTVFTFLIFFF